MNANAVDEHAPTRDRRERVPQRRLRDVHGADTPRDLQQRPSQQGVGLGQQQVGGDERVEHEQHLVRRSTPTPDHNFDDIGLSTGELVRYSANGGAGDRRARRRRLLLGDPQVGHELPARRSLCLRPEPSRLWRLGGPVTPIVLSPGVSPVLVVHSLTRAANAPITGLVSGHGYYVVGCPVARLRCVGLPAVADQRRIRRSASPHSATTSDGGDRQLHRWHAHVPHRGHRPHGPGAARSSSSSSRSRRSPAPGARTRSSTASAARSRSARRRRPDRVGIRDGRRRRRHQRQFGQLLGRFRRRPCRRPSGDASVSVTATRSP